MAVSRPALKKEMRKMKKEIKAEDWKYNKTYKEVRK